MNHKNEKILRLCIIIFLPIQIGSVPVHSCFSYNTPLSTCGAFKLHDRTDDSIGLIVNPIEHLYRAKKFPFSTSIVSLPLSGSFKDGHCSKK